MSISIDFVEKQLTEASMPNEKFDYTVFAANNLPEASKTKIMKYLTQRTMHKFDQLSNTVVIVVFLMLCIAIVREHFLDIIPLYQFIFNIILVVVAVKYMHMKGNYKLNFNDINSTFEILDRDGKKVTITNEDYRGVLEDRIIQIFFGFFIALSFFFTQVTKVPQVAQTHNPVNEKVSQKVHTKNN